MLVGNNVLRTVAVGLYFIHNISFARFLVLFVGQFPFVWCTRRAEDENRLAGVGFYYLVGFCPRPFAFS